MYIKLQPIYTWYVRFYAPDSDLINKGTTWIAQSDLTVELYFPIELKTKGTVAVIYSEELICT